METLHLCCESSLEAGEVLYASASRADVWMLLEFNAVWGAKALPESNLPDRIKSFLNLQQQNIPNARFQFIKQANRSEGIRFYIARSDMEKPVLYRFDLQTYGDLLDLDIPGIASGQLNAPSDEQLFIVCTNAKRDTCCARNGLPLFRAVSQAAGEKAWETTHLGGHRFAGTMACLPHGLYYGRVPPERGSVIVESYQQKKIVLENFRGCSAYDAPVQAADYFLRQEHGLTSFSDLSLVQVETLSENSWSVQFKTQDNVVHTVPIQSRLSDFEIYESTPDTEKHHVTEYHLVETQR